MRASTLLVLCSCPSADSARQIAESLVKQELAACASLLPGVTSVYRWQGRVESSAEALLLIKTSRQRYPELEQALSAMHPYELPEIIAVPVEQGLQPYLDWVEQCTHSST